MTIRSYVDHFPPVKTMSYISHFNPLKVTLKINSYTDHFPPANWKPHSVWDLVADSSE